MGVVSDRITPEAVAKVAKLARLSLSDDELLQATHQLSDMLDHFADIDALDLDGVEPMTHPTPIANVMREDIEMDCLDRDEVLAAAPAAEVSSAEIAAIAAAHADGDQATHGAQPGGVVDPSLLVPSPYATPEPSQAADLANLQLPVQPDMTEAPGRRDEA